MKASIISIGVIESMVYGGIAGKNQLETFVFSPYGTLVIVVIFLFERWTVYPYSLFLFGDEGIIHQHWSH